MRIVASGHLGAALQDLGNELRVQGIRARQGISDQLWASRRPPGKARGVRIPGVFERRATQPGGMNRRPEVVTYSLPGPKATLEDISCGVR